MSTDLTIQKNEALLAIQNDVKFEWVIPEGSLECKTISGLGEYVVTVHWRYQAQYKDIIADTYGVQVFEEKVDENFTPFSELKKETVTGWLESVRLNGVGGTQSMQDLQDALCARIEQILNPPVIKPPLPWLSEAQPTSEPISGDILGESAV